MGYSLGDVLKQQLKGTGENVSNLDTSDSPQRIEYIDIGLLDADPRNRRDLRGLEELAANIELLGLRQPLRVRENPESPGRFIIVSGHRRRAYGAAWRSWRQISNFWDSASPFGYGRTPTPQAGLSLFPATGGGRHFNG